MSVKSSIPLKVLKNSIRKKWNLTTAQFVDTEGLCTCHGQLGVYGHSIRMVVGHKKTCTKFPVG